jgi:hypothetical protein
MAKPMFTQEMMDFVSMWQEEHNSFGREVDQLFHTLTREMLKMGEELTISDEATNALTRLAEFADDIKVFNVKTDAHGTIFSANRID